MHEILNFSARLRCALIGLIAGAVMGAGCLGAAAADDHAATAAKWPLVFPMKQYLPIPGGRGMAFFQGLWHSAHRLVPGGPMTVTDGTIEFRESSNPTPSPYKVLHEGPNYVLFVTRDTFEDGDQWTRFRIFAITSHFPGSDTSLRSHSCSDVRLERSEPFDWPVAKLIDAFKSSWCLEKIAFDVTTVFGWSSFRFQRDGG